MRADRLLYLLLIAAGSPTLAQTTPVEGFRTDIASSAQAQGQQGGASNLAQNRVSPERPPIRSGIPSPFSTLSAIETPYAHPGITTPWARRR